METNKNASPIAEECRNIRNDEPSKAKEITSPGTLQDVTMENSYGIGYRSPCVSLQPQYQAVGNPTGGGPTSPVGHGRSVREFEEQMATLRKENFNLKLRLYFIEESIPGYNQHQPNTTDNTGTGGQETLMKQLIDLKVEMEMLRKEIQEKQELLKEAAQAMNQMERIQKDMETKSQVMIDELRQKLQYYEMECDMEKSQSVDCMNDLMGHAKLTENMDAVQKIRELEGVIRQAEERLSEMQQQIGHMNDMLCKRDETIKEYEDKVRELVFQNAELLESLECKENAVANIEAQQLRKELQDRKLELADKTCMLQEAEEKLQERTQIHDQACRTIQKLMLTIKAQQDEVTRLKNTATGNTNASGTNQGALASKTQDESAQHCTGLCRSFSDSAALAELSGSQQHKYELLVKHQETTIKTLRAEIKKKTSNLQNLVNKELWEKNREIERLTKLLGGAAPISPCQSPPSSVQQPTVGDGSVHELQQSFTDTEYARALERNKMLQRKVNLLLQRLRVEHKNERLVSQLRSELCTARADTDRAEKWRSECADVCAILSNRLEELAGFLNSLLRHKDVLGVLAADRRHAMRKAVDRSLDLSKSLNRTLSISGMAASCAQLGDLSLLLGEVEGGTTDNRTFNSHEELFAAQQQESAAPDCRGMKKETMLERKKERRSMPLPTVDASESEWSEPDRKVSLARIGLEEAGGSLVCKETEPLVHDTDSESDVLPQNGDHASKNVAQGQTPKMPRVTQLEQLIAQRDDHILKVTTELVEADNRLQREQLRMQDMAAEIEQSHKRYEDILMEMASHGLESAGDEHADLCCRIENQAAALEVLRVERDRLVAEARLAEVEIAALQADAQQRQEQYAAELAENTERQTQRLKAVEEHSVTELAAQQRRHEEMLARDWIARTLYEETRTQLVELQRQYTEAQRCIDGLNENEQELKQTLLQSELAARGLKKQLDESTLQASKTVLERTKAFNDKMKLEKRVEELCVQLDAHQAERDELAAQLAAAQSGYTSEELQRLQGASTRTTATKVSSNGDRKQISSPDLGIESDAGRHSSVEISNAQRMLLQTIELNSNQGGSADIAAVINSDEQENIKPSNGGSGGFSTVAHDCVKVEQENVELRRKLIRTKRAFEDTYEKLRVANQRKAQVEKDIKNQILKTHNVLKNVRTNMENDL